MYEAKAYIHTGAQEPIRTAERLTLASIREWVDQAMKVDQRIGVVRLYRDGRLIESHAA